MFPVVLITIPLSLLGTLFNSISFSYFIKRRSKRLGNRLLMFLNFTDMIVTVSGTITASLYYYLETHDEGQSKIVEKVYEALTVIFASALLGTAFATCLVSVTRALAMTFPFYRIKKRYIFVSAILFITLNTVRQIVFVASGHVPEVRAIRKCVGLIGVILLLVIIIVVLISNIVSVCKLQQSRDCKDTRSKVKRENQKQATITVTLLSVIFCVLNSLYITGYIVNATSGSDKDTLFYIYTVWVFIPFNSVLNPIVYISRKRGMRDFLTEKIRSFSKKEWMKDA